MSHRAVRCLRPYLFHGFKRSQCAAYTRNFTCSTIASSIKAPKDVTNDYEKRLAQLEAQKPRDDWYPRLNQAERTPVGVFQQEFAHLVNDETRDETRVMIGTISPPT
jgi:lysyl-tRNA synthetase class 2